MRSYEDEESFFSALASKRRLEILDCISAGTANPGEISVKLRAHRSAIEKHLRILKAAGIVNKKPSLNRTGQLTVEYSSNVSLEEILEAFRKVKKGL